MITVWLHPNIARFSDSPPEREFDSRKPEKLRDVLESVFEDDESLYFRIVDETGNVRRHINVFVGNESIRDLDAIVPDNSQIQIITAVSGG